MSLIHAADEVSKLYERLQSQRDKLKEQLEEVEREFDAVATTLKLMGQSTPGLSSISLNGMKHIDALVAIAKANNNILVVKTARRVMVREGLFKTPKNASSILFTAINRSDRFERISPGKYKLVERPIAKLPSTHESAVA
jgi:hypothetical protein